MYMYALPKCNLFAKLSKVSIVDCACFLDLESNIAGINEDIKSFDARLKFAADIQSVAEVHISFLC